MSRLDKIVEKAVEQYRLFYFIAAIISILLTVSQGHWIALAFQLPMLGVLYFVGLKMVGWIMGITLPASILAEEGQRRRIIEINRRLENGELKAESEELEEEMRKAGLKPLSIITEYGPIFGTFQGFELFEWVVAKQGLKGDVKKYLYVGQAAFNADGTVTTPNDESLFLVLDGVLYECSDLGQGSSAAVVGRDQAV